MAVPRENPKSLAITFTEEKQQEFLRIYAATGLLNKAAAAVGHPPQTIHYRRKMNPEFDAAVHQAKQDFCETIEAEIVRRGRVGVDKPVFQKGQQVGVVREYSDMLLLALAKRHIPEYRDKHTVDVNHTGGVLVVPGIARDSYAWESGDQSDAEARPVGLLGDGDQE